MQVHNEFNGTDRPAGSDACASRVGIALAFVIAIGFALRIAYLISVLRAPGFVWGDPDGYLDHALLLARGPHGWHWTFDAVKYEIKGQVHALPPLYTVFLSVIALFPGLPQTAQLAQVLLSTTAIFVMFQLGRLIHSTSAGLWAAGAYAVSVPAIFAVWSTQQETVYIPLLLLAFWLLARAIATNARPAAFAAAGLAFGLAALTRSMPVFFILPAAAVYVAMATDRRSALIQALGFVAGFAIVTGAYSAALSREFDQFTFIDSHGSIHLRAENDAGRAPGFTAAAAALWREIARSPQTYFEHCLSRAQSLLHVNGGRQLQIYVVAGSEAAAALWKVLIHLGTDAVLVVAAVLGLVGAALCRQPRISALFLLWIAVNVVVASAGGFGGARLRMPFEPFLMILASVVLAGDWRRPHPALLTLAIASGVAAALIILPQIPRSLSAWPDFGIRWDSVIVRRRGQIHGTAGINVPAFEGTSRISGKSLSQPAPIRLDVRAGRALIRTTALDAHEQRISWPAGPDFVELRAVDMRGSAPADVEITIERR